MSMTEVSAGAAPSLAPPPTGSPERVRLDGGEFGLLLAAADVVTLMPGNSLSAPPDTASSLAAQSCGYLEYGQQRYPVFCLNKALQLQSRLEPCHQVLVLLRHQQQGF